MFCIDVNRRTLERFNPADGCDEPLNEQIEDGELLSECCGAPPASSMVNDIAICSKCGEWADFKNQEEM